jgi:hypothetical protein
MMTLACNQLITHSPDLTPQPNTKKASREGTMTYIPKVHPLSRGTEWQRKYNTVAAYWSEGWELRHLDWLRYHGLWGPESLVLTC